MRSGAASGWHGAWFGLADDMDVLVGSHESASAPAGFVTYRHRTATGTGGLTGTLAGLLSLPGGRFLVTR
jgi:hypothetical protein